MENTAESMYKYFLALIRKERTSTINPVKWNEWINAIVLDWVKTKLPENEFVQKRIDDLEAIKVRTNDVQFPFIVSTDLNSFPIPYEDINNYPRYLHGLSAEFKTSATSSTVYGKIMRSDNNGTYLNNPFRQTTDAFAYFDNRGGLIHVRTFGTFVTYTKMILEYFSYPDIISYIPDDTENSTAGSFHQTQNQEIVELSARKYLERITDPRYQSFSMEQISTPG